MSLTVARSVLMWCTLMNFGLLALWSILLLLPHGWLLRFWGTRFRISHEAFDSINFAGIVLYKLLILMFNAIPYIALLILGDS